MPMVKDEAVCIRQWDWSETSQTVSMFGRGAGVFRAVAKGSKREDSKFSGGVEVLTRGLAVAIMKPSGAMATLTTWDLQETFPVIRRSLPAFYAAMYLADLVHHAVHDADPHPGLFDALVTALRGLSPTPNWQVLRFQWAALTETGFRPELDRDVATGAALAPAQSYTFVPRLGGLSADAGQSDRAQSHGPGAMWRVRRQTVDLLRSLDTGPPTAVQTDPQSERTVARATRLLAWYWREVLGAEPASMGAYLGSFTDSTGTNPGIK